MAWIELEVPHLLILGWLAAGFAALWFAHRAGVPRARTVNILLPMALGLVIFALYVGTRFNYDFLIDDADIIEQNPDVRSADGWRTVWTQDYWSGRSTDDNLYRPVVMFSYWLNARLPLSGKIIDGDAVEIYPRYFRGVNMALLALTAWLIALWLSTWVQPAAAWIAAFLFAAHPSNAIVINYVVGRADLLAVLGIVGFLCVQRRAIMAGRWTWPLGVLAVGAAIVALGSKETGLILIPAAAAQAWIGRRDAGTRIYHKTPATPKPTYVWTFILLAVPTLIYLIARFSVVGVGVDYTAQFMDDIRDNPLRQVGLGERIPAAFAIAWFYFKQVFWPDTSYYHVPAELPTWTSAQTYLGVTVLVASAIALLIFLRRRHWAAIAIVIALGQYALIGNLLTPVGVYAANRLTLPFTLAAALMLAGALHVFCGQSTRRRAVAIMPAALVVLLCAFPIADVNFYWASTARMIGRDFSRNPDNPVAQYNIATVRAREAQFLGQYARLLERAIQLSHALEADDGSASRAAPDAAPGAGGDAHREQLPLMDRAEALRVEANELYQRTFDPQYPTWTAIHHERSEITEPLRSAAALMKKMADPDHEVAVPEQDLRRLRDTLEAELLRARRLRAEFLTTARDLLERVTVQRPESINAHRELAEVYDALDDPRERDALLKVTLIADQCTGCEIDLLAALDTQWAMHQRRLDYIEFVSRAVAANPGCVYLKPAVIEARVKFGESSIMAARDPALTQIQLRAAEVTLAYALATAEHQAAKVRLHELNMNAKRYLSFLFVSVNDLAEAHRRHAELLKLYPEFQEAFDDIPRLFPNEEPQ